MSKCDEVVLVVNDSVAVTNKGLHELCNGLSEMLGQHVIYTREDGYITFLCDGNPLSVLATIVRVVTELRETFGEPFLMSLAEQFKRDALAKMN